MAGDVVRGMSGAKNCLRPNGKEGPVVEMFQKCDSKNFSRRKVLKRQGMRTRFGGRGLFVGVMDNLHSQNLWDPAPPAVTSQLTGQSNEILSFRSGQLGPHSGWGKSFGVWAAEDSESNRSLGRPHNTPTYSTIYSLLCWLCDLKQCKTQDQKRNIGPNLSLNLSVAAL